MQRLYGHNPEEVVPGAPPPPPRLRAAAVFPAYCLTRWATIFQHLPPLPRLLRPLWHGASPTLDNCRKRRRSWVFLPAI